MSVFRDEKRIAELLEQLGGIETPISDDLEERMISGLEAILAGKSDADFPVVLTSTGAQSYTADKTIDEIVSAAQAHKNVYMIYDMNGATIKAPINTYQSGVVTFYCGIVSIEEGQSATIIPTAILGNNDGGTDIWAIIQ